MEKIEKQIKDQMYKAYYDLIYENVNSEKPDYDWITKLYIELRDRLSLCVKKDSKTYNQIYNDFDEKLFYQMILNDVFDFNSMLNLINNTYDWILKLEAPVRDQSTIESKNKVLNSEPKNIIPMFLKEVHICINNIQEDLENYIKKIS